MKRSRFTEEQIIGILREQEAGVPVADLCRKPAPIRRPDAVLARRVAEEGGYADPAPTSAPEDTQRRHRTGRTAQLNLKVTSENRARFAAMADDAGVSMNVLFERALDALSRGPRK